MPIKNHLSYRPGTVSCELLPEQGYYPKPKKAIYVAAGLIEIRTLGHLYQFSVC